MISAAPPTRQDRWPASAIRPLRHDSVRIAQTPQELEELGQLRYRRFVIDQGQPYRSSSTTALLLIDPIDALSLNLYIRSGETIAIALRISWVSDVGPGDYLSLLHDQLDEPLQSGPTIICSRFVVASQMIDLTKIILLLRRAYAIGLRSGCRYSALSTHEHRAGLFQRFGYRMTGRTLDDPVAGLQRVLMLDLHDMKHLERIRSPLLPIARRVLGVPESSAARRDDHALEQIHALSR